MNDYAKRILNLVEYAKKEEDMNFKRTGLAYEVIPEHIAERMIIIKSDIDKDIKEYFSNVDTNEYLRNMDNLDQYTSEDDLCNNDNYLGYYEYESDLKELKEKIEEYFKLKEILTICIQVRDKDLEKMLEIKEKAKKEKANTR